MQEKEVIKKVGQCIASLYGACYDSGGSPEWSKLFEMRLVDFISEIAAPNDIRFSYKGDKEREPECTELELVKDQRSYWRIHTGPISGVGDTLFLVISLTGGVAGSYAFTWMKEVQFALKFADVQQAEEIAKNLKLPASYYEPIVTEIME